VLALEEELEHSNLEEDPSPLPRYVEPLDNALPVLRPTGENHIALPQDLPDRPSLPGNEQDPLQTNLVRLTIELVSIGHHSQGW